jgi:hypothetical protein
MNVLRVLFRIYRPTALWFGAALVLVEVVALAAPLILGRTSASVWLLIAGSATRYWVLVVGIMLVGTHLRRFVAAGATRREFLLAAAALGAAISVAVAILVPLGHGLEDAVLGAADRHGADYPGISVGSAFGDFGGTLATSLAFFVSGGLFAMGYYRFSPWTGTLLLVPFAVPLAASQALLGYDTTGGAARLLPYLPAMLITFAAIAAGAVALQATMRDVAIRRTGN